MGTTARRVMKRERLERKLGQAIDKYMREKGHYLHFIKGIVKPKESPIIQKCVPAYSIGTISPLIGLIVISDELPSIMRDSKEFDLVIAHGMCVIRRVYLIMNKDSIVKDERGRCRKNLEDLGFEV